MQGPAKYQIQQDLQQAARQVDSIIDGLLKELPIADCIRPVVTYAMQGPGKRIRAILVLWSCELVSGQTHKAAEMAAAAIEMVHTYSLVHDDLPAMDNDDMRRGRPTCHKAFDEASAILAGDALLTMAFEVLATKVEGPGLAVQLIGLLANAAGPDGMVAGQMADLLAERSGGDLTDLQFIHLHKTAKLFGCATMMGGLCGGADQRQLQALGDYGRNLGLVFQITDDLLDISGSAEQLGKTPGKDQKAGKLTYPAVMGRERSLSVARQLTDQALGCLGQFGEGADRLRTLARLLLQRSC